jgi:hypothetical protein
LHNFIFALLLVNTIEWLVSFLGADNLATLTMAGIQLLVTLAGGRTLAEVRDAAGHCNVSITSSYLHVVVEDRETVGSLF